MTMLDIQVSCDNIDFDDISPKALAFGAKALQVSFNSVHKNIDGLKLAEVTATPIMTPLTVSAGTKTSVRGIGSEHELSTKSLYFVGNGLEEQLERRCRFCGGDDDATAMLGKDKLDLWEKELTAILNMSPYDSLSKAGGCSIAMAPRRQVEPAVERRCRFCGGDDEKLEEQPVTIDVQCANMDFSNMHVDTLSVASKVLAESFGAIHSLEGNSLNNIFLTGPRLAFGEDNKSAVKRRCRFCGGDDDAWVVQEATDVERRCRFCGGDDQVTADYAIEFSATKRCRFCGGDDETALDASATAVHRAWEELFSAKMMKQGLDTGACKLVLMDNALA